MNVSNVQCNGKWYLLMQNRSGGIFTVISIFVFQYERIRLKNTAVLVTVTFYFPGWKLGFLE